MPLDHILRYLNDLAEGAKINGMSVGNGIMIVGATLGSMGIYTLSKITRSDLDQLNPEVEYVSRMLRNKLEEYKSLISRVPFL